MPTPRLQYIPLRNSFTARFTIVSLTFCAFCAFGFFVATFMFPRFSISFSILFSRPLQRISLSTKIPGTWISSGSIYPGSTISSTSAITVSQA